MPAVSHRPHPPRPLRTRTGAAPTAESGAGSPALRFLVLMALAGGALSAGVGPGPEIAVPGPLSGLPAAPPAD